MLGSRIDRGCLQSGNLNGGNLMLARGLPTRRSMLKGGT